MNSAWARAFGGVVILAVVVWQVGTGPLVAGVRLIDGPAIAAALAIGLLSTVCAAWRWTLVAAGLGVRLPLRQAVAACYGSQFLNMTLPGGVIGDVHRAVRHGLDLGDVRLGVRAVVLERVGGTTVQIAVGVIVLSVFPSPVRPYMPVVALGAMGIGLIVAIVLLKRGELTARVWAGVALASTAALFGHLATFLLAARVAGSTASLALLVPLTLFALLAMVVPVNIAGWGLREGAAAWVFAAAGLTATQGLATAVTYGVLSLLAGLPGAGVLIVRWISREPAAVAHG